MHLCARTGTCIGREGGKTKAFLKIHPSLDAQRVYQPFETGCRVCMRTETYREQNHSGSTEHLRSKHDKTAQIPVVSVVLCSSRVIWGFSCSQDLTRASVLTKSSRRGKCCWQHPSPLTGHLANFPQPLALWIIITLSPLLIPAFSCLESKHPLKTWSGLRF